MAGLNKISLIGHLGRDPEMREFSGNKVCSFSLAVTEKYTDREGKLVEKTEWFSVSFWSNLADIPMRYLKKGNQVYIEGKLSSREYLDREGKTRFALEVRGQNITLLGGNPENTTAQNNANTMQQAPPQKQVSEPLPADMTPSDTNGEDLPF
ncbi:MAG: single-stranded DNA-binding protein [Bacteroidetes bacterium]|nr:MAG: single-stranded DNA-binding protein [Bacteroidota bacterium]TAG85206.1 MAG: single-stranded DNA-binding protein [Bacteroidota bacterium]